MFIPDFWDCVAKISSLAPLFETGKGLFSSLPEQSKKTTEENTPPNYFFRFVRG